jgi:hypothetical protein
MESRDQTARIRSLPLEPPARLPLELRFELRYRSLHMQGRGYAFPCDAAGHVDLDQLSERARENYFFARAMVGFDLLPPQVSRAH